MRYVNSRIRIEDEIEECQQHVKDRLFLRVYAFERIEYLQSLLKSNNINDLKRFALNCLQCGENVFEGIEIKCGDHDGVEIVQVICFRCLEKQLKYIRNTNE